MKLLGWMDRKFRQGRSNDALKDFSLGNPCNCLTGQCYPKPNNKSFPGPGLVEELEEEESSAAALSDLFHGFLAIGTLGTDPLVSDPSTPTFSISVENIAEKESQVTENELKLINDELEKVLQVADHEGESGRSSHCSTITIGGKPIESIDNTIICPLQGYLFGSAAIDTKKEHRPSLGELFQKTKLTDENYDSGQKRAHRETDKSALHLMKKILGMKKGMLHTSSTAASGETKLNKILHIFHRKVHPDSSTTAQKTGKPTKNEINNNQMYEGAYKPGGFPVTAEDVTTIPKSIMRLKTQSRIQQFTMGTAYSNGNRECWIKTDADYLVLEL